MKNFYPRSPCGERPLELEPVPNFRFISIHALLAESDVELLYKLARFYYFYPRSPCGERRKNLDDDFASVIISIHALLAESDPFSRSGPMTRRYFYPRSPCGERHKSTDHHQDRKGFLSTLSLRRATRYSGLFDSFDVISIHALLAESDSAPVPRRPDADISIHALLAESDVRYLPASPAGSYFYPRSPCGERLNVGTNSAGFNIISIHALLAESDKTANPHHRARGYFYPRSPCGERQRWGCRYRRYRTISIHALLAESDGISGPRICKGKLFLSTLSLRRATTRGPTPAPTARYFYPRSPCGERQPRQTRHCKKLRFLSTLSLRRATPSSTRRLTNLMISIHALLAESDHLFASSGVDFSISIHALLAESDLKTP